MPVDWFVSVDEPMSFSPGNSTTFFPAATGPLDIASSPRIAFRVGEISFGVTAEAGLRIALDPGLSQFEASSLACDVEISAELADELKIPDARPAFESGGLWSAFKEGGGTSFYFQTSYLGESPYKRAWFNRDFSRGRVMLLRRYFDPELPVYPLEYPLDELLMIHRLAQGEGAEIHACGVVTADGTGRLFVGHSGAGKSTTSRLWLRQPGSCVLSDDRIILRLRDGKPLMYGTPWHGDAGLAAQASATVHQILLLEHAERNEFVPLDPARAIAELFARTFVPYHSPSGLAHTLDFLEKLTARVPVAVFRFVPDGSAVEEILRAA
jgi:AAA domain-containing protein